MQEQDDDHIYSKIYMNSARSIWLNKLKLRFRSSLIKTYHLHPCRRDRKLPETQQSVLHLEPLPY